MKIITLHLINSQFLPFLSLSLSLSLFLLPLSCLSCQPQVRSNLSRFGKSNVELGRPYARRATSVISRAGSVSRANSAAAAAAAGKAYG